MEKVDDLFLGQDLFLILRSQLETCFDGPSINHEYFHMPLVIHQGNHLSMHQAIDNHFSVTIENDEFIGSGPNSFIYFPLDQLWVNAKPSARRDRSSKP